MKKGKEGENSLSGEKETKKRRKSKGGAESCESKYWYEI